MPVLIVGADTTLGGVVVRRLAARGGEIRTFVSDPGRAAGFRDLGAKVAIGDLSDESHIEGAALGAHTVVMIQQAARDGRELSFASPADVPRIWMRAAESARARRIIVVGDVAEHLIPTRSDVAQVEIGERAHQDVADEIAALDDAARLGEV